MNPVNGPRFTFPTNARGWVAVVIGATVGLIGGGVALNLVSILMEKAKGVES